MLIVQDGAVYLYFLDRIIGRAEGERKAMRALILASSILAIVASAHVAKAGLSSTPRETLDRRYGDRHRRSDSGDRGSDRPHQGKAS